jgi:hypothetical protein
VVVTGSASDRLPPFPPEHLAFAVDGALLEERAEEEAADARGDLLQLGDRVAFGTQRLAGRPRIRLDGARRRDDGHIVCLLGLEEHDVPALRLVVRRLPARRATRRCRRGRASAS